MTMLHVMELFFVHSLRFGNYTSSAGFVTTLLGFGRESTDLLLLDRQRRYYHLKRGKARGVIQLNNEVALSKFRKRLLIKVLI
jgi:hypothetical protein